QGGQHGPELADKRQGDSGAEKRLGAESHQGQVDLQTEYHPRERAGQEDDQQRVVADEVDPVDERPELERRRGQGDERFREEGSEPTEGIDERDRPATDGVEGAQRRGERSIRHARGGRFPAPRAGNTGRTGGTSGRRRAESPFRSTGGLPTSRRRAAFGVDS